MTKLEKNIYLFAVLLLLASTWASFTIMRGAPEQLLLLVETQQWLSGKRLYYDIFTVQPPVIFCLYALPVYLSVHIGIFKDYQYLLLLGLPLLLYVIHTAFCIIRFHPAFVQDKKKQWQFCLLLLTVCISFQNSSNVFDREYLLFVLTLPYLLRFMPSVAALPMPRSLQLTIGILAGVGFAIKPYSIILFAGVNLAYILRHRSFAILQSTENSIIYLINAIYLLAACVFARDYIHIVLPMALATYSGASRKIVGIVFFAFAALAFFIPFADFRLRHTSPYRRDIFYLLFVAFFLLLYALAGNGWGYTWNPLASLAPIITGFLFWEYRYLKEKYEAKGLPVKEFLFGARACLIAFSYNVILAFANLYSAGVIVFLFPDSLISDEFKEGMIIANDDRPITSFGAISIDFAQWSYVARQTGASWDTRFNQLWMLPKLLASDDSFRQKNAWILDYVGKAFAEDLDRNRPEIIFVDDRESFYTYDKYVDLTAYLAVYPEFVNAWSHYRYAGRLNKPSDTPFKNMRHGYYVYQRKD